MTQQITEESGIHKDWYVEAKEMKTPEQLTEFVRKLTQDFNHDYGTICHAIAAVAVAGANVVNRSDAGGITGFQAGCVMWEMIKHWMQYKDEPLRMVHYENMLYPQYEDKFEKTISKDTWEYLQKEAAERITKSSTAHPDVIAHWKSIESGIIPFGYTIGEP